MNSKYFNITVKPDMTGQNNVSTFTSGDLLFDWTSFLVPKGGAKLIGVTSICRGINGARQEFAMDLYFASTQPDLTTAPSSLGTVNSSVSGVGYGNELLGCLNVPLTDFRDGLDYFSVAHTNTVATGAGIVMDDVSSSDGYNTYYLGVVSMGNWDFNTGTLADDPISVSDTSAVVKGTDARKVFSPGDVLVDNGNAAIGTVKSVGSATAITFEAGATEAVAADDEIVTKNPITFILHFER